MEHIDARKGGRFTYTPAHRSNCGPWEPGWSAREHYHEGADEIFYFIDGVCEIGVGKNVRKVGAGTLVYVPSETPHTLRTVGDRPVHYFLVVAPNRAPTHSFQPFAPEAQLRYEMTVLHADAGVQIPRSDRMRAEFRSHGPGWVSPEGRAPDTLEWFCFVRGNGRVTAGGQTVQVSGPFSAVYIPAGEPYRLENTGEGTLLYLWVQVPDAQK